MFVTFFAYINQVAVWLHQLRQTGARFSGWALTGRKGLGLGKLGCPCLRNALGTQSRRCGKCL